MSLRPILPLWALILVFLPLLTLAGYLLVRSGRVGRASRWGALRLLSATVLLLFIGLRPSVPDQAGDVRELDLDVVLAVDVTISMGAEDYDGDSPRLEGVRADIDALADELPGARFSLVTYGAFVRTEVPFTTDVNAVRGAAEVLNYEFNHTSRGTSLEPIPAPIAELLDRADETHPDRTRILVVFGDGEQTVDDPAPFDFASLEEKIGGGLVLGYGTEDGGRMRSRSLSFGGEAPTGLYLYDRSTGQDAISRIDEENLNLIADQLGVEYEHRSQPGQVGGLDEVVAAAEQVDPEEDREATTTRDVHWWFAIPLLGLATIEVTLAARRIGEITALPRLRSGGSR